ncbi:DUF2179 domain-containing protein [Streptomyces hydrogenans]
MDHDTDIATGTYSDEPRLALLTVTEARETVELLQILEQLDPDGHGQAARQLAADLARRLPSP